MNFCFFKNHIDEYGQTLGKRETVQMGTDTEYAGDNEELKFSAPLKSQGKSWTVNGIGGSLSWRELLHLQES